ncbi:MAG: inositol phosphatase [Deltaproteobacteria bacterium]|jgi:histidinol-phosphatase|nr:inositol phosphatase [Deltaproteobacteria bacterium]
MSFDLLHALEIAKKAVAAAAEVALPYWEQGVIVETKADLSPVTAADRESEAVILRILSDAYPNFSVLAEESGARDGDPTRRWIVDPIDGTRGFTRGGKFWGALVGLEIDGDIVAGAMGVPALGDFYWAAKGHGAYKNGHRLQVSMIDRWDLATVSLGEMGPLLSPPHGHTITELIRTAASARCYGDVMGAALVLNGLADVWLEAGVKPWDLAPSRILLEEAGGRFTTFRGDTHLNHGTAIGSNGRLHTHALERLAGAGSVISH